MKKLLFSIFFALATLTVTAIPAKHGIWQTLTLNDGTEVRAQLTGDEHLHFWQTEDGRCYIVDDSGTARSADMEQMRAKAKSRRSAMNISSRLRSPKRVSMGDKTHYTGQKKGIVILMQFKDTKFKSSNNKAKYNDILNQTDYTEGSFKGSVADYFRAQSGGQFELHFDIAGPYTAKNNASYYGSNDNDGNDNHPDELIVEALEAADSEVDFNDYDWDGDGKVDQVFVLYAGKGEADGGGINTIWPHMWFLSDTGMEQTLDGVHIDTYACANEVTPSGSLNGIGCFCHEFSHCLGYPDFYDTSYSGWFGMSEYDLMDQGSYNGNSFRPAGYTAYEKWMAGWLEPTVLADEDVTVENLAPTSECGGAYIMYNDAWPDEYYIIENRQKTEWDTNIPGKGLMITHVDFDKTIWEENTPNTKITQSDILASGGDITKVNDHQRCTIFHADNDDDSKYWSTYGYYSKRTLGTDLYPYSGNDSLTATSKPAASLYNNNKQGKKTMEGALLSIKQNSDGTMNFKYRAKSPVQTEPDPIDPTEPDKPIEAKGDTLFYESFDKCASVGGNDGKWSTTIAGSTQKFATDNPGWEYEAAYAGYQCARFGNGTKNGQTTTPLFTIDGEAVLTFRAAGWNNDGMELKLSLTDSSDTEATISDTDLTMQSFQWTDYETKINGTGTLRITFTPSKRFLLDEVLVMKLGGTTAIADTQTRNQRPATTAVYTLDGRFVGSSLQSLPRGIYVIAGRKFVK